MCLVTPTHQKSQSTEEPELSPNFQNAVWRPYGKIVGYQLESYGGYTICVKIDIPRK